MPIECRERYVIHTEQYCPATGEEWVFDSEYDEWCPTNCIACNSFTPVGDADDAECEHSLELSVHKEPR
jgi:hypothetical protein